MSTNSLSSLTQIPPVSGETTTTNTQTTAAPPPQQQQPQTTMPIPPISLPLPSVKTLQQSLPKPISLPNPEIQPTQPQTQPLILPSPSPKVSTQNSTATTTKKQQQKVSPKKPTKKPSAATVTSVPAAKKEMKDKMGRSTSCYLCQKRKQKCDHRIPCCTTCIKAGVPCIQPPRYSSANEPNSKDEYTVMLEKRVKQLEKILEKLTTEKNKAAQITGDQQDNSNKVSVKREFSTDDTNTEESDNATTTLTSVDTKDSSIKQDNNSITSHASQSVSASQLTNTGEPSLKYRKISDYLDQTSSENDPFLKLLRKPYTEFLSVQHDKFTKSLIANYNLRDNFKPDPIFDIDIKVSKQLMDIYFALLQYKFPLLNENQVLKFHNDYFQNKARGTLHPVNDPDYIFQCTRMFLIFAISSELHKTTGRYTGPAPQRFFSSAMRYLTLLSKISELQKIELLILIVFYLIRTDKDSNVTYMIIVDGMKICMKLNLHKRKTYEKISRDLKDNQLRCFWCAYLLEKAIAIAVSQPFILLESQIDEDILMFDYEPSKAIHPTKTTFINQSIKIRRIEARFIEQLNIITSNSVVTRDQLPKVESFFQELANWRRECQGFRKGIENETLSVYYYRSVRNLIQPFLELLDPEDKLFRECQACAGQICQSVKAFIQKTVAGHSTVHIHTAFNAGITLIYCLWLHRNRDDMRRKLLGDDKKHTRPAVSEALFSGLDDLRACSDSLYVMAERTKFALGFRDTFEEIMHATIGNLILRCGPDSSEIIYTSQPGVPPAILRKPLEHYTVDTKVDIKKTDAEKKEEEERFKKMGQLTRCAIPRGLSHLLIHSPDLGPENDPPHPVSVSTRLGSTATNAKSGLSNSITAAAALAASASAASPPNGTSLLTPAASVPLSSPLTSLNATTPTFASGTTSLFKTTTGQTYLPAATTPPVSMSPPPLVSSLSGAPSSYARQRKESMNSLSSFTSRERETMTALSNATAQMSGNSLSSTTTLTNNNNSNANGNHNRLSSSTTGHHNIGITLPSPASYDSAIMASPSPSTYQAITPLTASLNLSMHSATTPSASLYAQSSLSGTPGNTYLYQRNGSKSQPSNQQQQQQQQPYYFSGAPNIASQPVGNSPIASAFSLTAANGSSGNTTNTTTGSPATNNVGTTSASSPNSTTGTTAPASSTINAAAPNSAQTQLHSHSPQQLMQTQNDTLNTSSTVANTELLLPFVGRTSTMINNISVWTGESGQQIPNTGIALKNGTHYQQGYSGGHGGAYGHNGNSNGSGMGQGYGVYGGYGQVQIQNNSDNTGTNNPLDVFSAWGNEDFWNVTDNFGFLP